MLERGDNPEDLGAQCQRCPLRGRALTFPELGARYRGIVLIGEAPGREEAASGSPFRGRAGKLLNQALLDAGIDRSECMVTNGVLCHPRENLKPPAQALAACRPRLWGELQEFHPSVIVALGNQAIAQVVAGKRSISAIQGTSQRPNPDIGLGEDVLVVPAWHPAYVLRNRSAYADLVRSLKRAKLQMENPHGAGLGSFGLTGRIKAHWVRDDESARELLSTYPTSGLVGVDIETSGLNPYVAGAQIFTISFAFSQGIEEGWVVDFYHYPKAKELVRELLGRKANQVWHNGMFDLGYLREHGIDTGRLDLDTLLVHYAYDEGGNVHGLEHLADQEFGSGPYKSIVTWKWDDPEKIDWPKLVIYNACDAFYTLHLAMRFMETLRSRPQAKAVAQLLHRGADPLMAMAQRGLRVDHERVLQKLERSQEILGALGEKLASLGVTANLNSTQQLSRLLYDQWGLLDPDPDTGKKSVDKEHMDRVATDARVALILEYKKVEKLAGTFLRKIPDIVDRRSRVHTLYKPQGTTTGRLSSGDSKHGLPNLQQIPQRDDPLGIREIFIPEPGNLWVSCDLSQAELRVMAAFSGDAYLKSEIEKGTDLHTLTAAVMLKKRPEDVTPEDRQRGKTLNFALTYGMGADHLARSLSVDIETAERMRNDYLANVPGLLAWRRAMERKIQTERYVETPTGRRRHFLYIDGRDPEAIRKGVNAVIQSVASDITLIALIRFYELIRKEGLRAHLLVTIHDSIDFEAPAHLAIDYARVLQSIMVKVPQDLGLGVPFVADIKIGPDWGSLKEVYAT